MHRILLPAAAALLFASACGPLIELEDENTALRSRVDSLEIVLAECRGQGDLLQERLSAIENENLQLDDRNRDLAARIAELQYTGGGRVPFDPDAPAVAAAPQTETGTGDADRPSAAGSEKNASPVPDAPGSTTQASAAEAGLPGVSYDGSVSPGISFLQKYQTALNTYNGKRFEESLDLFADLLRQSAANDMTDNCVYWMGEAAVQLGRPVQAVALFSTVIGYRGADKVDDALASRAAAYSGLGRKEDARADLERLLREFPGSEHAGVARQMLRTMR